MVSAVESKIHAIVVAKRKGEGVTLEWKYVTVIGLQMQKDRTDYREYRGLALVAYAHDGILKRNRQSPQQLLQIIGRISSERSSAASSRKGQRLI